MRRLAVAAVCALALCGCVTPSIPIPPPDPAAMVFTISGSASASSAVFAYPPSANYKDSVVYLYNRTQGTGIILDANPDGSVGPSQPLSAIAGNQIDVTFQRDDQSSSSCIVLQPGHQDPNNYCD
jgi:hypothetical protein